MRYCYKYIIKIRIYVEYGTKGVPGSADVVTWDTLCITITITQRIASEVTIQVTETICIECK